MTFIEVDAFPIKKFDHGDTEVDEFTLNDDHSLAPEGKTNLKDFNKKEDDKLLNN